MKLELREDRLVVGLTGPVGSGVSTTAVAIKSGGTDPILKPFIVIQISKPIKEELRKREGLPEGTPINEEFVPNCRKKLQDIGDEGRNTHGLHYWVQKAFEPFPGNGEDLVVDGIRNLGEVAFLRRIFPRFFLVSVHAYFKTRWERVDKKYKGNQRQFIEDDLRDQDEDLNHGQQVSKCTLDSDFAFLNEKDLQDTANQKRTIFEMLCPDLRLMKHFDTDLLPPKMRRTPSPNEVHMATAYSQSHRSNCLKRHVGAVVVSIDGIPLSIGFNENPRPLDACSSKQFENTCFKDGHMNKKLEEMAPLQCPKCGQRHETIANPWKCVNPECKVDLKSIFFPSRGMELCTALHAEERAIRTLGRQGAKDGIIYASTFPCLQCSRYIIDAGIKEVVYVEPYPVKEAIEILSYANVKMTPFQGFKARAFNQIFKQVD